MGKNFLDKTGLATVLFSEKNHGSSESSDRVLIQAFNGWSKMPLAAVGYSDW